MSKLVTVGQQPKRPVIIVQDLKLRSNYYRATEIVLKQEKYSRNREGFTNIFYIYWNEQDDFKRGLAKLKRRYDFQQIDIDDISGTTAHRYVSTKFTAKGFKP